MPRSLMMVVETETYRRTLNVNCNVNFNIFLGIFNCASVGHNKNLMAFSFLHEGQMEEDLPFSLKTQISG